MTDRKTNANKVKGQKFRAKETIEPLTKDEALHLEEYKNCTQVVLDANRLLWTRFNI